MEPPISQSSTGQQVIKPAIKPVSLPNWAAGKFSIMTCHQSDDTIIHQQPD
jgi:hypothetical protein